MCKLPDTDAIAYSAGFQQPSSYLARQPGTFRADYKRPDCFNVHRTVEISITMPSTMTTLKPLATPIGLIGGGVNVQALVTSLRGITRIDGNNFHASTQSFVTNKQSQLVKSPTVRPSSLRFGSGLLVCSVPNPCQILQGDTRLHRFRRSNDALRNAVIDPGLEPTLTTSQPLQQLTASPSRTACALTGLVLELGSQVGKMITNLGYVLPIPVLTFRSVCNICTPQIHAQNLITVLRFWWLRLQANLDVIGTISPLDQGCRLWVRTCQHSSLVVSDRQFKPLTTINSGERNCPILFSKREDSSVVSDKASFERFHWTVLLFGNFAGSGNSSANLLSQITRQAKSSANLVITEGLQLYCIDYLLRRVLVHPVQRLHKSVQRRIQFYGLRLEYLELAGDS